MWPAAAQSAVRAALVSWYHRHGRHLPWRDATDPYAVWVSEVMLQQTRVATVLPYYRRWMVAFPTLRDLAAARQEEVLRLWQGLGYYARARHLHRAAQLVVADYDGRLPVTAAARLPPVRHVFTHIRLSATPIVAVAAGGDGDGGGGEGPRGATYAEWRWIAAEALADLPVSTLMRKLVVAAGGAPPRRGAKGARSG